MSISNSPTLCTQLWNHAVVDLANQKVRVCCKTAPIQLTTNDILLYNKEVFLNLPNIQADRALMLAGGKPTRCNTCWNLEDTGNFSFRNGPRQWQEYFSKLPITDYTTSYYPDNLDIQLDNLCDLKCLYCNEEFSSQWQSEKQKFGELINYIAIEPDSNSFVDLFFDWFNDIKHNFKRIAFLGGEPLISPKFYLYLNRILASYNNNIPCELEINIITNLNTSEVYFDKFIKTIEQYKDKVRFNINISMEAWGEQAEAIRHGVSIARFEKNLRCLAKIAGIKLSTITTVNLFSLSTLDKYLEVLIKLEEEFNITIILYPNLVSNPSYLQVALIPNKLGIEFINRSINILLKKNHQQYIEFLYSLIEKFNFENLKGSDIHVALLTELDKLSARRNINYKGIFHEYQYLWT